MKMDPGGLAGELGAFAIGNCWVKVEAICHAEIRHVSYLEVHATVVYAFDVCGKECLGVYNPVHNVLVVLTLMGGNVVSVEFKGGIDGCKECPQ